MHRACVFTFLCFATLPSAQTLSAQSSAETNSSALDAILAKAERNIEAYRTSAPNVYCTEHATAKRKSASSAMGQEIAVPGGAMPLERSASVENAAETTSIFRLKRLDQPSDKGLFEESRILQKVTYTVDAPGYEEIAIPELLYGVFSNGLNILSREGRACFAFDLKKIRPGKLIIVDFKDLPSSHRAPNCPANDEGRGTIKIEPGTMQVTEIDRQLPHHLLVGSIEGTWEWKVQYAPVALKASTYWFPSSITSRSVSSDQRRTWSYAATYKDYHLFFSTTRILQGPGE